jgi:hypothetical protein
VRHPLALGLAFLAAAPAARAAEGEVSTDVTAQFYDVRSPTGATTLSRRRVTVTLGVAGYDLLSRPKEAGQEALPDLQFRARLRYDADYGARPGEVDGTNAAEFVPGFDRGPVDLMYAYVEGRRFLKGTTSFKLGRQYLIDPLGWWSFDGGSVKVTAPWYFAVEGYGGMEVRGGLPLSPAVDRFSRDGLWRGNRGGVSPSFYPSYQGVAVAPAWGAAIETAGVTFLHGRLSYRQVYNTETSGTSQFASGLVTPVTVSGVRTSQERLGYSANVNLASLGGLSGGWLFDFYANRFTSLYASLDAYVHKRVTVGVDYDWYKPSFDGDSIWNFFAAEPMNYVSGRVSVDPTDRVNVSASGFTRAFMTDRSNLPGGVDVVGVSKTAFTGGGTLAARYRTSTLTAGLRGNVQLGEEGSRAGGDVYGDKLWDGRFVTQARVGLWGWEDKQRADRDAVSFGYALGLGYKFYDRAATMVELQHDVNRLVGNRFRVVLWLTLAVVR